MFCRVTKCWEISLQLLTASFTTKFKLSLAQSMYSASKKNYLNMYPIACSTHKAGSIITLPVTFFDWNILYLQQNNFSAHKILRKFLLCSTFLLFLWAPGAGPQGIAPDCPPIATPLRPP